MATPPLILYLSATPPFSPLQATRKTITTMSTGAHTPGLRFAGGTLGTRADTWADGACRESSRLSVNLISEDGLKYATAFCRVSTKGGQPFCKRMPLAIKDPVR